MRIIRRHVEDGVPVVAEDAPELRHPLFVVHARRRASAGLEPALALLRAVARSETDRAQHGRVPAPVRPAAARRLAAATGHKRHFDVIPFPILRP